MAGDLQPLDDKFAIVGPDGRPTLYFIEWAQQRQIDITDAITLEILQQYLDDHALQEGSGIQITPSGSLNDSPTIAADVQEILDQITTTRGSVLYRNASDWVALAPGTSGQFLKTNGAGADPAWATVSAGSSYERTRTIPTASQFTLQNAGTAAAFDKTYGLELLCPSAASNIRFLKQNAALPGSSWTMIVRMQSVIPWTATDRSNFGICIRNSSNGRIVWFAAHSGANSLGIMVQRYTNYSTFSANAFGPFTAYWMAALPWWRIVCNGTTMVWSVSPDGDVWCALHTETIATFLTAAGGTLNEIGIGAQVIGQGAQAIFQSYEVA